MTDPDLLFFGGITSLLLALIGGALTFVVSLQAGVPSVPAILTAVVTIAFLAVYVDHIMRLQDKRVHS